MSTQGPCPGARSREIRVQFPTCTVAKKSRWRLRSRGGKRDLAVSLLWRIPRTALTFVPLFCVPTRNAGPMVQADLPFKAFQKMALLALGGVSSAAARHRSLLHLRGRTPVSPRVFLALPL